MDCKALALIHKLNGSFSMKKLRFPGHVAEIIGI